MIALTPANMGMHAQQYATPKNVFQGIGFKTRQYKSCTLASHLLHHDGVVALKRDVHVHVGLHWPDLVGRQEALPAARLPARLTGTEPLRL